MEQQQLLGIGSRIKDPKYGIGVIVKILSTQYRITFMQYGIIHLPHNAEMDIIEATTPATDMVSLKEVTSAFNDILQKWAGGLSTIPLGNKWDGGTLILKSADPNLKPKEMPIDTFFHKIVMVRDRLRVMEQRINSSKLSDEEKVNLQQYITRIYGSLTSFNILFKNKSDHFKGAGGS